MSEYAGELRRKLHEGLDATEEIEALQSIKDEYAAYYAEQMDKLHNEQAKEYLQGGEVPSKERIGELLRRMAAGDTLTEQEKGFLDGRIIKNMVLNEDSCTLSTNNPYRNNTTYEVANNGKGDYRETTGEFSMVWAMKNIDSDGLPRQCDYSKK